MVMWAEPLGKQLCLRAVTPGLHSVPSGGTEYHGRVTQRHHESACLPQNTSLRLPLWSSKTSLKQILDIRGYCPITDIDSPTAELGLPRECWLSCLLWAKSLQIYLRTSSHILVKKKRSNNSTAVPYRTWVEIWQTWVGLYETTLGYWSTDFYKGTWLLIENQIKGNIKITDYSHFKTKLQIKYDHDSEGIRCHDQADGKNTVKFFCEVPSITSASQGHRWTRVWSYSSNF